jgi:hypothetical protein
MIKLSTTAGNVNARNDPEINNNNTVKRILLLLLR